MAKVTLVNANLVQVPAVAPYALDVLATSLHLSGHDTELLDLTPVADDYPRAIEEYFSNHQPNFVVITFRNAWDLYFNSIGTIPEDGSFIPSHARVSKEILKYFPRDRIIAGGIGFSAMPQYILEQTGLRFGIVGAGEKILPEVIRFLVTGIATRDINGFVEVGYPYTSSENGDISIVVNRKNLVNNKWYYENGGLIGLRTSNGCEKECVYCIEPKCKGGIFLRNPELVVAELDQLVEQKIWDIHFADNECNIPMGHSKKILRAIITRGYPKELKFWSYAQILPFDEEYASLAKAAGVAGILFSTDHIDQDILEAFGKNYRQDDIIRTTQICKAYDILVMHELIFGMPGDNVEKIKQAIDFMREVDPYVTGITVGIGVMSGCPLSEDKDILRISKIPPEERKKNGLYCNGKIFRDPTYYVSPALKIPETYYLIRDYIGDDIYRIMAPTEESVTKTDNQLVGSKRIKKGRRGAYWAYYRELFEKT